MGRHWKKSTSTISSGEEEHKVNMQTNIVDQGYIAATSFGDMMMVNPEVDCLVGLKKVGN